MRQYGGYTSRRDNQGYQGGYSRSSHNDGYSQSHQKREYQYIRPYHDNNNNNSSNYNNGYNKNRYNNNNKNHNNNNYGHRHDYNDYNDPRHRDRDRNRNRDHYDRYERTNDRNGGRNDRQSRKQTYLDNRWEGVWEVISRGANNGNLMIVQFEMDRKTNDIQYILINQKWDQVSELFVDPNNSMTAHMISENTKYEATRNFFGTLRPPFDKVDWYEHVRHRDVRRDSWRKLSGDPHSYNRYSQSDTRKTKYRDSHDNSDNNKRMKAQPMAYSRSDESHASHTSLRNHSDYHMHSSNRSYNDMERYNTRKYENKDLLNHAVVHSHDDDNGSNFDLRTLTNDDNATFLNEYNEKERLRLSKENSDKRRSNFRSGKSKNQNSYSLRKANRNRGFNDNNDSSNNNYNKNKYNSRNYCNKNNNEISNNNNNNNRNNNDMNDDNNNNGNNSNSSNSSNSSDTDDEDNNSVDYNVSFHPNYEPPNWDLVSKLDLMPRENEAYNEWKSTQQMSPNRVLIKREEKIQNAIDRSKPKQIRRVHERADTNGSYRSSKYRRDYSNTSRNRKEENGGTGMKRSHSDQGPRGDHKENKYDEYEYDRSNRKQNDYIEAGGYDSYDEGRDVDSKKKKQNDGMDDNAYELEEYERFDIHGADKPPHTQSVKYLPHILVSEVDELVELNKNIVYVGELFISRWNPMIAYVHVDEIERDVRVNGLIDRNRAFNGDKVAVSIYPPVEWTAVVKKEMEQYEEELNERDGLAGAVVENDSDIDDDEDDDDAMDLEDLDDIGASGSSGSSASNASSSSSVEERDTTEVTDDDEDDNIHGINNNDNNDKNDKKNDTTVETSKNIEMKSSENKNKIVKAMYHVRNGPPIDVNDIDSNNDEVVYFDNEGYELGSKRKESAKKIGKKKNKSQLSKPINNEKNKSISKKRRRKDWSYELVDPRSVCALEHYEYIKEYCRTWDDVDAQFAQQKEVYRQEGNYFRIRKDEKQIDQWKNDICYELGDTPHNALKNFKWENPNDDLSLVARGKIVGIYERNSNTESVPGYLLPKVIPRSHGKIYKRWVMFIPLDARLPKAWFAVKEAPMQHKQLINSFEKEEILVEREHWQALQSYAVNDMVVRDYELRRLRRERRYSRYPYKLRKEDLTKRDLMMLAQKDKSGKAPKRDENRYLAHLKCEFLSVKYDLRWFEYETYPTCKFVEYLGKRGVVDVETAIILQNHNITATMDFGDSIESVVSKFDINKNIDYKGRLDCRNFNVFTIDPTTARDFDDALSIYKLSYKDSNGKALYRVGIHIADVTHFVKPGSPVDNEAQQRATSVYLVDRCIPMLPHHLCQNLCSLNPNVDRLAYSVFININENGHIVGTGNNDDNENDNDNGRMFDINKEDGSLIGSKAWEKQSPWFGRSVIRSTARLNYEAAHWMIENKITQNTPLYELPECCSINTKETSLSKVISDVKLFWHLAKQMRKRRFDNGSVEFHRSNIRFRLDEDGKSVVFCPEISLHSNKLIEEMMLLANQIVASQLVDKVRNSALLRKHPAPDMDRGKRIELICRTQKWNLNLSSSKEMNESLRVLAKQSVNGMNAAEILNSLLTQPMERAEYICVGDSDEHTWRHWALNFPLYTHFTSPIRRYADVLVHRLLSYTLSHSESKNDDNNNNDSDDSDDSDDDSEKPTNEKISTMCSVCNDKNREAGRAEIDSKMIHLCLILIKKPLVVDAIIIEFMKNSFTVVVPGLGIDRRVKLGDIKKCKATILMQLEKSQLILNWDEKENCGDNDESETKANDDYYQNQNNNSARKPRYKKKMNRNGNRNRENEMNERKENDFGANAEVFGFFSKIRVMLSSELTTPIQLITTVLSPSQRDNYPVTVIPTGEQLSQMESSSNSSNDNNNIGVPAVTPEAVRSRAVAVTLEEQLVVGQEDFNGARYD